MPCICYRSSPLSNFNTLLSFYFTLRNHAALLRFPLKYLATLYTHIYILLLYMSRINSDHRLKEMEEQVEMVGRAFVDHYYNLFDHDRTALQSLYHPSSMLTFEGQRILGVDQISAKLSQLPFNQCRHVISTVDSQPSAFAGGVVVFVSGSLHLDGEDHPLRFSQMFHLTPTGQGSYFVQNDIFRLNYG